MKNYLERIENTAGDWNSGILNITQVNDDNLVLKPVSIAPESVDIADYCTFSASPPGGDWIEAIHVEDQEGNLLLDFYDSSPAENGYQDNTDMIITAKPGDILTISVTVNNSIYYRKQYLSWGHDIMSEDLVTIADLYGSLGYPWTHTYQYIVPDRPGNYLVSWWERYSHFGSPCDDTYYGERRDFTLNIGSGFTEYNTEGSRVSPELELTPIESVESSLIEWEATVIEGVTEASIETSLNGGLTWSPVVNYGPVPGIIQGMDLSNLVLSVKENLITVDTVQTPVLHSLRIKVAGAVIVLAAKSKAMGVERIPTLKLLYPDTIYVVQARACAVVQPVIITGDLNRGILQGTVTKKGIPVSGARIIIVNSSQEIIQEIVETDEDGHYSAIVYGNDVYHLIVEYQDDDGLWQALSKPFVQPERGN